MARAAQRAWTAAALVAAAAAILAVGAQARPAFGVSDDSMKFAADGGASLFPRLVQLGMTENRATVFWDPDSPSTIQGRAFLDRMLPVARARGIRIVFAVYPVRAAVFATDTDARIALFGAYLGRLARRYPQVSDFVVGNEPNENRFLQPQHAVGGAIVSAGVYERVLAAGYDALKSVNPATEVIGMAISPDANDRPLGANNESVSPVRFIAAVGEAYRQSGRTAPLMDELAFHLHARVNTESLTRKRTWPNAGAGNLDRVKQAVWDAFAGTGQPTFAEAGHSVVEVGHTLRLFLDEMARQVSVVPSLANLYRDSENVATVDEATQAQDYADTIRLAGCDPTVSALLLFHLVDEQSLTGFQSGLLRLDRSERPSFGAVRSAIASTSSCASTAAWAHATGVIGGRAAFDEASKPATQDVFGLTATADENAYGKAGIFRLQSAATRVRPADIARALTGASPTPAVRTTQKLVKANNSPRFEFHGKLRPGYYVYAIRLSAELNPSRSTTLVSRVFAVNR
jgi:hypothetical protein